MSPWVFIVSWSCFTVQPAAAAATAVAVALSRGEVNQSIEARSRTADFLRITHTCMVTLVENNAKQPPIDPVNKILWNIIIESIRWELNLESHAPARGHIALSCRSNGRRPRLPRYLRLIINSTGPYSHSQSVTEPAIHTHAQMRLIM